MPLVFSTLYDPLLKLCMEGSRSKENSAAIMTDSYVAFTSTAVFPPSVPVFTGLERELLYQTILNVLNPALMNPAGLGLAWSAGIQAYWLAPPILCVGAWPGQVTLAPDAPAALPGLTAVCSIPFQPSPAACAGIASQIFKATASIQAQLTSPAGPVLVTIA